MSSVRQGGGAAASVVEDEIDVEAAAVDARFDELELFVAGIAAVVGREVRIERRMVWTANSE